MRTLAILFTLALLAGCRDRGTEPLATPPEAPTNFRAEKIGWATNVAVAIVKVSWNPCENAQGFVLSIRCGESDWVTIATIEAPATSYLDGVVKPGDFGGKVTYRIWAYNEAGTQSETVTSNEVTF